MIAGGVADKQTTWGRAEQGRECPHDRRPDIGGPQRDGDRLAERVDLGEGAVLGLSQALALLPVGHHVDAPEQRDDKDEQSEPMQRAGGVDIQRQIDADAAAFLAPGRCR